MVYNPLPNGLHFEWTLKALVAGKHVLLEKPSVSNAEEAELLFRSPLLQGPKAPVLLEAFHYRFQPSWIHFLSFLDRPNIAHASSCLYAPKFAFSGDDIRFNYDLGGGALLDLGYTMSALRGVYGTEPVECTSCDVNTTPPPRDLCDYEFKGSWRFPNGGTADMHGNLRAGVLFVMTSLPAVTVTHRPVRVEDSTLPAGQEKTRARKVTLHNFILGALWHRIDVEDEFVVRVAESGEVVKKWTTKESHNAYTLRDAGIDRHSEPYWTTYKHQLDAFVDRIRGREGTGAWIDAEESIRQMRVVDMAYEKSRLPLRQTSKYRVGAS